jgi:hypothetical protein
MHSFDSPAYRGKTIGDIGVMLATGVTCCALVAVVAIYYLPVIVFLAALVALVRASTEVGVQPSELIAQSLFALRLACH